MKATKKQQTKLQQSSYTGEIAKPEKCEYDIFCDNCSCRIPSNTTFCDSCADWLMKQSKEYKEGDYEI